MNTVSDISMIYLQIYKGQIIRYINDIFTDIQMIYLNKMLSPRKGDERDL